MRVHERGKDNETSTETWDHDWLDLHGAWRFGYSDGHLRIHDRGRLVCIRIFKSLTQ